MINFSVHGTQYTVKSEWYTKYLRGVADLWFLSDLNGRKDMTTDIVNYHGKAHAFLIFKSNGVLAGTEEIKWLFLNHKCFKGLEVKFHCKDGDCIKKGQKIADINGEYSVLMSTERIVLNILQRMSGIATQTERLSRKVAKYGVKLACTRKTYFGPLDKKACIVGGGTPHRAGLWDAVLVKDNHFNMGFNLKTVKGAQFIEIEVENLKQLDRAILELENIKSQKIVMLDNFDIKKIPQAIIKLRKSGIAVEISGGISDKNLADYAKLRPDIISMGWLTQNAKAADVSLELGPVHR